jgi:hypothetical protein
MLCSFEWVPQSSQRRLLEEPQKGLEGALKCREGGGELRLIADGGGAVGVDVDIGGV